MTETPKYGIITSAESGNLYFVTEDGENVLHKDCLRYKVGRREKNELLGELTAFCAAVLVDREVALDEFVRRGVLKKMDNQDRARKHGRLWEIRGDGHGFRIIFVLNEDDTIVVSAVNKQTARQGRDVQSEAINRGLNRWEALSTN